MMRPQRFPSSPSYQAVVRALLRMHRFTVEGQEESEEAESLRESMSEPWEGLSMVERDRVTGLSKDLYEMSDHPDRAPAPMNPQAQGKLDEAYEARERGEWDRALGLLRRWGKCMPAPLLSYLRGRIWSAAGDAATAAVFLEHASQLAPENEVFQARLLDALKTADPSEAAARANVVLQKSEARKPIVVVRAADIIFEKARRISDAEASPTYRRLIPILERTLAKIEDRDDVEHPAKEMAFMLLATCYREIGDTQRASGYYSRAIQMDPTDDTLLTARGMLMYGTDPNAPADFEQAIRLGSQLVWPYFYLARHYLANNRFDDCRLTCERALQKPASKRVQSELWELLAISRTHLGYPEPDIRRAFENSLRDDPSNDRALRNFRTFETAGTSRTPQPKNWESRSESSLRAFAQQENAYPVTEIMAGGMGSVGP
jgi:tetratricopeptide (TPR) repeat protein